MIIKFRKKSSELIVKDEMPNFSGKYGAKLEIPEGVGGFDLKNHSWGRYGNFMEPHIKTYKISTNGKKPLQEYCSLQSKGTIGGQRLTRAEHTLTILSIKGIWFS